MARKRTDGIVVHHTVTGQNISPEDLRAIFRGKYGVNYIGYNFWITGNGAVRSDIGSDGYGIHNNVGRLQNYNSVGIALAGNFEERRPTQAQLNSLSSLIKDLVAKYKINVNNIVGHRELKATACPGRYLFQLKPWIIEIKKEGDIMWWEQLPNNATIWAYNNFKGIIVSKPYDGPNAWKEFSEIDKGTMAQVKIVNKLTETTIDKITKSITGEIGELKIAVGKLQTRVEGYETQMPILRKTHKEEIETLKEKHKLEIEELVTSINNTHKIAIDKLKRQIRDLKESTGQFTWWEKFINWIKELRK